jgi:hypothetical protein
MTVPLTMCLPLVVSLLLSHLSLVRCLEVKGTINTDMSWVFIEKFVFNPSR